MTNEEKILEMLTGMQAEMSEIKAEVKEIHQKVDDLTEAHEETRTSVNALLDWAERASNSYDLPLPKLG